MGTLEQGTTQTFFFFASDPEFFLDVLFPRIGEAKYIYTAVKHLGLQSCATTVIHVVQNQTLALYYPAGEIVHFCPCGWTAR